MLRSFSSARNWKAARRFRVTSSYHNNSRDCICGLVSCVTSCPARTAQEWDSVHSEAFLAPYLGSPWEHIDFMLDTAGFQAGQKVLDLGAGIALIITAPLMSEKGVW